MSSELKRVLANSLPKNGTHLLLKCLGEVPGYRFSGFEIDWGDPDRALAVLGSMQTGEFTKGHIPCFERAKDFVANHDLLIFNMIRDPRDNIVSLVNYLMSQPNHPLHAPYSRLASDNERIMATIRGVIDEQGRQLTRDIGWRMNNWIGWDNEPKATALRFEALIGPRGGGDASLQLVEIRKMLHALGINNEDLVGRISEHAFDNRVHSFHKGQIGRWKSAFTKEHKSAFKEVANWTLLHYGYENDDQW